MTKYSKVNGMYLINGKSYEMLVGSRAQVYHETAYKTSGGLKKTDLLQNKYGRIVSSAKYNLSKTEGKNNLFNKGYSAKKGQFGYWHNGEFHNVKSSKRTHKNRSKRYHGGTNTPETGSTPTSFQPSESPSVIADTATKIGGRGRTRSRYSRGGYQPSETRSLVADMATQIGGRTRSRTYSRKGGSHKQLFLG